MFIKKIKKADKLSTTKYRENGSFSEPIKPFVVCPKKASKAKEIEINDAIETINKLKKDLNLVGIISPKGTNKNERNKYEISILNEKQISDFNLNKSKTRNLTFLKAYKNRIPNE